MANSSNGSRGGEWGRTGAYGGNTPQPGDGQTGGWTREQRERMDEKFRAAFERALRSRQASSGDAARSKSGDRADMEALHVRAKNWSIALTNRPGKTYNRIRSFK
jgi:hypothetical protein